MTAIGDRVRLRSLPESTGTVVGMLDTPDYGPVPLVAFDDLPEHPEPYHPVDLEPAAPPLIDVPT